MPIVHSLNLENDIFIVGDLNMNWLDNKGEPLKALKHFPFCDHDLVLCECNFKTSKFIPTMIYSRKINEKSLNQFFFCFLEHSLINHFSVLYI